VRAVRRYRAPLAVLAVAFLLLLIGTYPGGPSAQASEAQSHVPTPPPPARTTTPPAHSTTPPAPPASKVPTATAAASPQPTGVVQAYNGTYEWPLEAFNAANLWRYSEGAGVRVAIVGTGIDLSHPDLAGAIIKSTSALAGWPADERGESLDTEIAALIAGRGSATDPSAVVGLAPEAELINIRVTEGGETVTGNTLAAGIRTAVAEGAQIIDVPLGASVPTAALAQAVTAAEHAGRLMISSAAAVGKAQYPAAWKNVLTVAAATSAMTPTGALTASAYGHNAIYAPGSHLYSADEQGIYQGKLAGDPLATGYVAAAAALVWAAHTGQSSAGIEAVLCKQVQGATATSAGLGVLDPGLAIASLHIAPGAGVATATSPPPSTAPPTSPAPRTTSQKPSLNQVTKPPAPGSGFSLWDLLGGAVAVVAVLGLVLAWVTRRRDPPSGKRHPRDWGLEPQ
jgi:hypothetical protein